MTVVGSGAVTSVTLNGFEVYNTPVGDAINLHTDISRYLLNGVNTLQINSAPPPGYVPDTDPLPSVDINVEERTSMANEYRSVLISQDEVAAGTLNAGNFDSFGNILTFTANGSSYEWEFTFADTRKFNYLPTRISYFSPSMSVGNMTIEFSDAAQSKAVVYSNISVKEEAGVIDLSSLTPVSGASFVNDSGFSRIKLSYTGTSALSWTAVTLERRTVRNLFNLHLPGFSTQLIQGFLDDGTITAGSAADSELTFADNGTVWEWEYEFPPGAELTTIPSDIIYVAANVSIGNMSVEFSNSDRSHSVVYSNLNFPAVSNQQTTINLSSVVPSSGSQFLGETDFSRVKLSYSSPASELVLEDVAFLQKGVSVNNTYTFNASPSQSWAWQGAQSVSSPLSASDKAAIESIVSSIHAALVAKDVSTLSSLLQVKAEEVAKLTYQSSTAAIADQENFFQTNLFADPNWGMQPLVTANLVYSVIAGGKVVRVTNTAAKYAIASNDITYKNTVTTFGLNFDFSLLPDGNGGFAWRVVH
ncbi:MAG: hypothetical protein D6719_06780 [Candidatus Dadabacteria bacterium]|nr:MAG: hypothetical protein D6719_06780 [Candidatus Dadabacteria bacterium]